MQLFYDGKSFFFRLISFIELTNNDIQNAIVLIDDSCDSAGCFTFSGSGCKLL